MPLQKVLPASRLRDEVTFDTPAGVANPPLPTMTLPVQLKESGTNEYRVEENHGIVADSETHERPNKTSNELEAIGAELRNAVREHLKRAVSSTHNYMQAMGRIGEDMEQAIRSGAYAEPKQAFGFLAAFHSRALHLHDWKARYHLELYETSSTLLNQAKGLALKRGARTELEWIEKAARLLQEILKAEAPSRFQGGFLDRAVGGLNFEVSAQKSWLLHAALLDYPNVSSINANHPNRLPCSAFAEGTCQANGPCPNGSHSEIAYAWLFMKLQITHGAIVNGPRFSLNSMSQKPCPCLCNLDSRHASRYWGSRTGLGGDRCWSTLSHDFLNLRLICDKFFIKKLGKYPLPTLRDVFIRHGLLSKVPVNQDRAGVKRPSEGSGTDGAASKRPRNEDIRQA